MVGDAAVPHTTAGGTAIISADALVLVSLVEQGWNGQWMLTASQKQELYQQIVREANAANVVTRQAVHAFASKEEHRKTIRSFPRSVCGILDESVLNDAFLAYGKGDHTTLDLKEWDAFLRFLERSHLKYLLKKSFQNFQAFYGRGQSWWIAAKKGGDDFRLSASDLILAAGHSWTDVELVNATGTSEAIDVIAVGKVSKKLPKLWQISLDPDGAGDLIPTGWFDDLWYYSSNNHPLHGIIAADPQHRLNRHERITMELATAGFVGMTVRMQELVEGGNAPFETLKDPVVFNIVITVIGLVVWWVLFLLFTCPCEQFDESLTSHAQAQRAKHVRALGALIGYVIVALGLGFFLAYVVLVDVSFYGLQRIYIIVYSRLRSYAIVWLWYIFVCFNPVVSWGQPEPSLPLCWGDYVGLGQWRIEKQRFQRRCLDAVMHTEAFGTLEGGRGVMRRHIESSKTSESFELALSHKDASRLV